MTDIPPSTAQRRTGLLESAVTKLFARSGQVLDIEEIGADFRLVTLGGESLRGVVWTPGDKIQIQLGGWILRTYTPIDWDAESGRTRILICLHAGGPGAQWARRLVKGDACVFFGPRRSLDLTRPAAVNCLFGDETSFGLAAALSGNAEPGSVRLFFEVSSLERTEPVLARLGFERADLSMRSSDNDAHLAGLEGRILAALKEESTACIVLSGRASAIQSVRKLLKRSGIGSSRIQTRAYWATGRTGLD